MRETLSAVLFVFVIENNSASFAVYVHLMINKVHSPCSLWLLQSSYLILSPCGYYKAVGTGSLGFREQ